MQKNSFGGPSWAILHILFLYTSIVCDLQKIKFPIVSRIIGASKSGSLRGRRLRGSRVLFFCGKTRFFQKTYDFWNLYIYPACPHPKREGPWGGRIHEVIVFLCFFEIFSSKKHPTSLITRILDFDPTPFPWRIVREGNPTSLKLRVDIYEWIYMSGI